MPVYARQKFKGFWVSSRLLPLPVSEYDAVKVYVGVEVELHAFLSSALVKVEL
jgi:hypothetical protein